VKYKPYIPQNIGEILDAVGYMMLASPAFKDKTGYFPQKNIHTAFSSLNEGLWTLREKLGEKDCNALKDLSDKMRTMFESDTDDRTGDTQAGRMLIHEMEAILTIAAKREASR
jgi:hypothetical protein